MLLGQMELALLGGADDVEDVRMEEEWMDTACPSLVQMLVKKLTWMAIFWLNANGREEAL